MAGIDDWRGSRSATASPAKRRCPTEATGAGDLPLKVIPASADAVRALRTGRGRDARGTHAGRQQGHGTQAGGHRPVGPRRDRLRRGGRPGRRSRAGSGNNGTVKVHDEGTADGARHNEPKVCSFRLTGFGFDTAQPLTASIAGHGGSNAGVGNAEAVAVTDADGDFAIGPFTMEEGMYKLTWSTGQRGDTKHKVFKVSCADGGVDPDEPGDEDPTDPTDPGGAT